MHVRVKIAAPNSALDASEVVAEQHALPDLAPVGRSLRSLPLVAGNPMAVVTWRPRTPVSPLAGVHTDRPRNGRPEPLPRML